MKIKSFICNPFCENTYVLYDEFSKETAIIDCGCYTMQEKQSLTDFIEQNSLKVKYLLNTHLHLDHVFGNVFITSKYGVLPFAHQADEILLENFDQQLSFFGLNAVDGVQALGGYLTEDDVLIIGEKKSDSTEKSNSKNKFLIDTMKFTKIKCNICRRCSF